MLIGVTIGICVGLSRCCLNLNRELITVAIPQMNDSDTINEAILPDWLISRQDMSPRSVTDIEEGFSCNSVM